MAKPKKNIVCPYGPIEPAEGESLAAALRWVMAQPKAASYPIDKTMCAARQQKGYFAGCEECEWLSKKPAKSPVKRPVPKHEGTILGRFKMIGESLKYQCPACGTYDTFIEGLKNEQRVCCDNQECKSCYRLVGTNKLVPLGTHKLPATEGKMATPQPKSPKQKKAAKSAVKTGAYVPTHSRIVGDKVSKELKACEGIPDMVQLAKRYGLEDVDRYMSLPNPGLVRMSIGNRIRGKLRRGSKKHG